ncbi:MAG: hypothetical protein ACHQHN_08745 [Sphingobacteriales bacterium]
MPYIGRLMIPYKRLLPIILILFCTINCFAQEIIETKSRLNDHVTESYYVLKAEPQIKSGAYQAFYKRKHLIAEGTYIDGKKIGIWNFYGTRGNLLERYNFNKDSLEYEASVRLPSNFHYLIDKTITDSDWITLPTRRGGRFYGFLPYINVFKASQAMYPGDEESSLATVELLISPMGRLASYKVHLIAPYQQNVTLSLNLFSEEQKKFIPATFNHQPILSRIIIQCRVTNNGSLDFYY